MGKWARDGSPGCGPGELPFALPTDPEEGIAWLSETTKPVVLFPNHNSSGDSLASCMLFDLRCPISVIPHWVTAQHYLTGPAIQQLLLAGAPQAWIAANTWVTEGVAAEQQERSAPGSLAAVGGRLVYEW